MDHSEEEEKYFAFFSLTGDRFDAPGMPADTAREVGNFREAVLRVARELWLSENPDRQRLPSGFNEAFDLRLVAVAAGSARPQMMLNRPPGRVSDQDWDEWSGTFVKARDFLTESLQSVTQTERPLTSFAPETLRAIRRVGSSLHESEAITLGDPKQPARRVMIDQTVRDLLEEIDDLVTVPEPMALEGVILEYDGEKQSFRLKTASGISTCRLNQGDTNLGALAKNYLALDGVTAPDVRVEGDTPDASQRQPQLFNIRSIASIRSIAEKILLSQIERIAQLSDGWLGPESKAPDGDVLARATSLIARAASLGIDMSIVPNSEGSVVFEWKRGDVEFSASIEPLGGVFLYSDNTVTDELIEKQAKHDEAMLVGFFMTGSIK